MMKLRFYILYGFTYLLSLQPLWVLYRYSDFLFFIIYYIAKYRRDVVETNLRKSFPDKDDKWRKEVEKHFYHFFCDYIVETTKLISIRRSNLMKRMTFDGFEEMEKSLESHNFVFVYLGHYGNWEWIASLPWWTPKGILCGQLYSPLRNDSFERLFKKIRGRFGGMNISKNESLRRIAELNARHQKSIIGFISDQSPKWVNIHFWMDFLHQDTPVFTGTERIAKKVNAAVYFAEVTHPRRGHYHCSFHLVTNQVNDYPEHELTRLYMQSLEDNIHREPSWWLWSHKRWKRQRTSSDEEKGVQT